MDKKYGWQNDEDRDRYREEFYKRIYGGNLIIDPTKVSMETINELGKRLDKLAKKWAEQEKQMQNKITEV